MIPSRLRSALPWVLVSVLLGGWILWLRAPTFPTTMWNVDEGIHAVVARTLLDGNVMYRDIVDHRTPLSYYAVAALFSLTGVSMTALHVMVALLVIATAIGLFILGRRTRGIGLGLWAAAIFAALSCYLLTPSDAYAAHTEWFLALFTTAAAVVFCSTPGIPSLRRSLGVGALLGLGFLSKQPGLVELGVPLGTLAYLGAMERAPVRAVLRAAAGVMAGFAAVVGSVALVFVVLGAWREVAFYTWTYNTRYYGPETSWADRLLSPGPFFAQLATVYPLVFVAGIAGALVSAFWLAQRPGPNAGAPARGWVCYGLLWCGGSLAGAMASGRSFDHYFIQCLPPFAWMAARLPDQLTRLLRGPAGSRPALRWLGGVAAIVFAGWLVLQPLHARKVAPPPADPALRLSAFIRANSTKNDKIFVWGYNPDIYLYANRGPATRFLYCTFQTGLIPWTNLDPAKDTTYAIVPGSMEALLGDLRRNPARFIVDCGVGPHRRFNKYPLQNFAPLRTYVEAGYVEIDPERYRAQGFRLFMRKDDPREGTPRPDGSARHPSPTVAGPAWVGVGHSTYTASSWQPEGADVVRLALVVDGTEFAAVRFPAAQTMRFAVEVPFDPKDATPKHRLSAVADWRDGTRTTSSVQEVTVTGLDSSPAQREAFALPLVTAKIAATGVRALLNPRADWNQGQREFALHAPSLVRYALPSSAVALHGFYGIPAGAYAPENKAPSDGAEFFVRIVEASGKAHVLLDRLLKPATEPADRPVQAFRLALPRVPAGAVLELEISPGPAANPSSDWTFWSDVVLETSP